MEKKFICLRDILDLLSPKAVNVTVIRGTDRMTASGVCRMWEYLEDENVEAICPETDGGLTVWLEREDDDGEG